MASFLVDFCDEVEEEAVDEEPKEDCQINTNEDEDATKMEVEEKIEIKWHVLDIDQKPDLPSEGVLTLDQVELNVDEGHVTRRTPGFQCKECDFIGEKKIDLKIHSIKEHFDASKSPGKVRKRKWFRCGRCDYRNRKKQLLQEHVVRKHGSKDEVVWLYCEKCVHRVKTKTALKEHVITKHLSDDEIKWFPCGQCDCKFKLSYLLKQHERAVHIDLT